MEPKKNNPPPLLTQKLAARSLCSKYNHVTKGKLAREIATVICSLQSPAFRVNERKTRERH